MDRRKVIPLQDARFSSSHLGLPVIASQPGDDPFQVLTDERGRNLRDLRISVTDRCNFRCSYCMPKEVFDEHHRFLPHAALLSFEEIARLARIFVSLGVQKIRLTGGEPLLRRDLERLISMLSELRSTEGRPVEVTLTTNGSALTHKAKALKNAGLRRVTVSLDALDDAIFQQMNDVGFPVGKVLAGIDAALTEGLTPIKVNMVVRKGTNDHEIIPLARFIRETYGSAVRLRFIEFMDVGATNGWRMDEVLPSSEVLTRLMDHWAMEPLPSASPGETAQRWRYADGKGEVGFISSVTHAFCHNCNRARLSTEGRLFNCLFATEGHDLRSLLRSDSSDDVIAANLRAIWRSRNDHYSELRGTAQADSSPRPKIEMHYIGG
jgi:GTP 3',8-cyclase